MSPAPFLTCSVIASAPVMRLRSPCAPTIPQTGKGVRPVTLPAVHRLKTISVIGGFLDGVRLDLADGLNCIIGARGTGKTTALELVRYASAHPAEPLRRSRGGEGRDQGRLAVHDLPVLGRGADRAHGRRQSDGHFTGRQRHLQSRCLQPERGRGDRRPGHLATGSPTGPPRNWP